MRSKFKFTAYLLGLGCVLFTAIMVNCLFNIILNPRGELWVVLLACIFFAGIWTWVVIGELRTRVISVRIENEHFIIKRFLGLGISRRFDLSDISGFKTSILSSKSGSYEYLYLMVGTKKIAKLSEFYHSNYKELKRYIVSMNIKNIGFEPFSNRQEFNDIFSV